MIELKVDEFEDGYVTFHISRQDKEDYKRLNSNMRTFEINGTDFNILKFNYPAFYIEDRNFFVRGNFKERDFERIKVAFSEYLIIFELVKKYNEKFS